MHRSGHVDQVVVYEYVDPAHYYHQLRGKRLREELSLIKRNMQYFLDQEKVLINGEDAAPRVVEVSLGFRGTPDRPYLLILIEFSGILRRGLNVYENMYEEEEAEYDYEVVWMFPPGMGVVEADVGTRYRVINGRILVFRVRKGARVGGYERIVFSVD